MINSEEDDASSKGNDFKDSNLPNGSSQYERQFDAAFYGVEFFIFLSLAILLGRLMDLVGLSKLTQALILLFVILPSSIPFSYFICKYIFPDLARRAMESKNRRRKRPSRCP
jgi:hypothetical protein